MADHVPEYAEHGKGEITIAHVLAHRAGVARLPSDVLDLDNLAERELLVKALSGRTGENIVVKRFVRWELGEEV